MSCYTGTMVPKFVGALTCSPTTSTNCYQKLILLLDKNERVLLSIPGIPAMVTR